MTGPQVQQSSSYQGGKTGQGKEVVASFRWKVIMGKFAKQSKSGTPLFDGSNYAFWSIRMRAFIEAQEIEIWQSIENGYKVPKTVPTDAGEIV